MALYSQDYFLADTIGDIPERLGRSNVVETGLLLLNFPALL
jgi:hypothetical protein